MSFKRRAILVDFTLPLGLRVGDPTGGVINFFPSSFVVKQCQFDFLLSNVGKRKCAISS